MFLLRAGQFVQLSLQFFATPICLAWQPFQLLQFIALRLKVLRQSTTIGLDVGVFVTQTSVFCLQRGELILRLPVLCFESGVSFDQVILFRL